MSIFDIKIGDTVQLFDPEAGEHTTYEYFINDYGYHIFSPLSEDFYTRSFIYFNDVLRYDVLTEDGNVFEDYEQSPNHYLYNQYIYCDVNILPIEEVFTDNWNNQGPNHERRMQSIRKAIFLPPINVRQTQNGYRVVDGNHRLAFSLECGYTHIPVNIIH